MAHRDGCKSVTDWIIGNDSEKRQGNSSNSGGTEVAITTGIKNGLHGHMHIRKRCVHCDIHLLTCTIIKRIVTHIFVSIFVQHVGQTFGMCYRRDTWKIATFLYCISQSMLVITLWVQSWQELYIEGRGNRSMGFISEKQMNKCGYATQFRASSPSTRRENNAVFPFSPI